MPQKYHKYMKIGQTKLLDLAYPTETKQHIRKEQKTVGGKR